MNLKIQSINQKGDAKDESIHLIATADVNIGDYIVVDRTFNADGTISDIHKHFFRFPSKEIKKGEYVSLRTCSGKAHITLMQGTNARVHRYYWGSEAAFLNDKTDMIELLKVEKIDSKKV